MAKKTKKTHSVILTDANVRTAQCEINEVTKEKVVTTYFDKTETDFYLYISKTGRKVFRVRLKKNGFVEKTETIKIGDRKVYPLLSLADARAEAKIIKQNWYNPPPIVVAPVIMSFEKVAKEWLEWNRYNDSLARATYNKKMGRINHDLVPAFGIGRDIRTISYNEYEDCLNDINFGKVDKTTGIQAKPRNATAVKVKEYLEGILAYAKRRGYISETHLFKGLVKRKKPKKFKLDFDIVEYYNKCDSHSEPQMRVAMKLQHHCWLRSSEIMLSEWQEFDLKKRIWTVPPERYYDKEFDKGEGGMKMNNEHKIPLTDEMLDLLNQLKEDQIKTGNEKSKWLFSCNEGPEKGKTHQHRDTLSKAFRVHLKRKYVPNDCRKIGKAWCNINGFSTEITRLQLAHVDENEMERNYETDQAPLNLLMPRTEMMVYWSKFLVGLYKPKPITDELDFSFNPNR